MTKRVPFWIGLAAIIAAVIIVCMGSAMVAHSDDGNEPALAAPSSTTATVPYREIYRLQNPRSGEHLYTPDAHERDVLTAQNGWSDEGIGWYAPREGGVGVYRLFNPNTGYHLYTTDTNETRVLTTQNGWSMDNNGKPLFLSGGSTPILRLYNPNSTDHLITKNIDEYQALTGIGWSPEGIKLYAAGAPTYSVSWPQGTDTIANVSSEHSIEATVTLSGSGSGYEASLVADSGDAQVRFGLSFDEQADEPYNGACALRAENILNSATGESKLVYAGYGERSRAYTLMMTVQPQGIVDCYVNGVRVKSLKNDRLANKTLNLRVESAGKAVGDTVSATFADMHLKRGGVYQGDERARFQPMIMAMSYGLTTEATAFPNSVTISGTVSSLAVNSVTPAKFKGIGSLALRETAPTEPTPSEPTPTPDQPAESTPSE